MLIVGIFSGYASAYLSYLICYDLVAIAVLFPVRVIQEPDHRLL